MTYRLKPAVVAWTVLLLGTACHVTRADTDNHELDLRQAETADVTMKRLKRQAGTQECLTGPAGPPGRDGRDGRDGVVPEQDKKIMVDSIVQQVLAAVNPTASEVERKMNATLKEINEALEVFKTSTEDIENQVKSMMTTTYTRWGKSYCPDGVDVVYDGYIATAYRAHKGGGSNHQCLPKEPHLTSATVTSSAYIYGAYYEVHASGSPFTGEHAATMNGKLPECAVCNARGRTSTLMHPAAASCPEGWTQEYKGFLMASHSSSDYRTEYICVDEEAEYPTDVSVACCYGGRLTTVNIQALPYSGAPATCIVCTM